LRTQVGDRLLPWQACQLPVARPPPPAAQRQARRARDRRRARAGGLSGSPPPWLCRPRLPVSMAAASPRRRQTTGAPSVPALPWAPRPVRPQGCQPKWLSTGARRRRTSGQGGSPRACVADSAYGCSPCPRPAFTRTDRTRRQYCIPGTRLFAHHDPAAGAASAQGPFAATAAASTPASRSCGTPPTARQQCPPSAPGRMGTPISSSARACSRATCLG